MERMKPPTLDEALEGQQKAAVDKIVQTIESNNLQYYKQAADELFEENDAINSCCSCFENVNKRTRYNACKLSEEKSLPPKRDRRQDNRKRSYDNQKKTSMKPRQGHGNSNRRSKDSQYKSKSNSYK